MASEGAPTQALLGAFTFGTVLYAASAALVLYIKGHGSAVYRDSQRLVLVSFLISSALWATIDFVTLLFNTTGSSLPCQIGVIFATVFDQLARFSIEQFLLWALHNNGGKMSMVQLIPQILVLVRFLVGAVFVGFTRPQTDDFCVATTSVLPVGVVVVALDVIIIMLLIQKAYSTGPASVKSTDPERIKSITSVLLGLACWTASSVVMMLGLTTVPPVVRTAIPAAGLLILIVFVTTGAWTLVTSRKSSSGLPEAPSPRRINISRDISTADSEFPPSHYEDLKEAAIRSSRTFVNPRDAPTVKDETSIGFPFSLDRATQQQPMRPPPASMMPALDRSVSKRGMFGFGQVAPASKLTIGRPILQNTEDGNPLSKITVIDLEQAAREDKERREKMQESAAENRLAVRSVHLSAEEGLKRAVSTKRKEVASMSSRQSVAPGGLQAEGTALTTSAQLSPAGDETRRRSPRPSPKLEKENEQTWPAAQGIAKAMHAWPTDSTDDTRPVTVLLQANIPQPIKRLEIRPSRMLPPSPDTPPQEPAKTPLQRRPTIGLPGNPRARVQIPQDAASQNKTIMFVNNIEYHDPVGVESIIADASRQIRKAAPPGRTVSVVNRPRPIPRKPADSPLEAAMMDPSHRRSKSGGSLLGRKSILNSTAGSPTKLPPLPTYPKSAGLPSRPHPNSTKSMTFDEKVALLFPAPPSGNTIRRRSSVPELPPLPKSFMNITPSPTETDASRQTKRTTKTSAKTESVLEVDEIQPRGLVNTQNEAGRNWLQAFEANNNATQDESKRRSSQVLPPAQIRASAWTETTDDRTNYDDGMTNWSPMNSPELAISIPVMQVPGLPASVRLPARQDDSKLTVAPDANNRATTETLPIMLDAWTAEQVDARRSWLLEDDTVTDEPAEEVTEPVVEPVAEPKCLSQGQWHRRVGDECPAFSERMEKTKSRKTPPTPLTLNAPIKKAIVIQSEPSPLESPEQALKAIQAQLKKLEEPDMVSNETPSKRLALLENLEKEMGMQQDHWKEMKHDIGRDSLSSVQTSSPAVRRESVVSVANLAHETHNNSNRLSLAAERRASRLSRISSIGSRVKTSETSARNSVRDSVSPQMSKWQKRLTEAQMEYMDARLVRESTVNFLQLSRAQLASPTPPDSDESDAEVPPIPSQFVQDTPELSPEQPKAMLWTPAPKAADVPTSLLWTHVPKKAAEPEAPLPGLSVRPAQRKESAPLKIESTQLWRKPYVDASRSTSGLWRPVWASAAPPAEPIRRSSQPPAAPQPQKAPRPLTQRPPRRNKRMTALPDILENPEPLPDNRGTLGIFQFPWGEKSDTAFIQPRPSVVMAMPGTMTSGGPAMKNEISEYSSSFFDDYDDDEDIINEVNSQQDDGSDEGFDESTLWEIASLLKVDNVPSRNSLLMMDSNSAVDDYLEELQSDDDDENSIVIGIEEPRELIFDSHRDSATLESSTLSLLEDAYQVEETPSPKPVVARIGLPANPRPAAPVAESSSLAVPRQPVGSNKVETTAKQGPSSGLWTPPVTWDKSSSQGLFSLGSGRSEYRTTTEDPAAQYMIRKPRMAELKPLDTLTSTSLWSFEAAVKPVKRNWIAGIPELKQDASITKKASSGLWTAIIISDKSANGLFALGTGRTEYRTTTQEPAARNLSRKPRAAELKPLDKLTSTNLWNSTSTEVTERNWILGVPEGKQEVVVAAKQVISTGLWNPVVVDDKSSAYGLFTLDSGRSEYRTTVEEPAAQYMVRKPRAAELKPLDKLASLSLWNSTAVKNNQRNWISGAQQVKKPRQARVQVTPEDWQAALDEAISASYPHMINKVQRVAATPAEWDAALEEAISLSGYRQTSPTAAAKFDSAVRHPVFAAKSLITKSEWFHPAATGYTYDIANIHPAFFGSLAITCPIDQVHPAISAYAAKKLRRQRSKQERSAARSRSRSQSRSRQISLPATIDEDAPLLPSRRDTIQAQIEALEQERLFVERAAKEDYRRRISSSYSYRPDPVPVEPKEEEPIIPTVEFLQRRLSQRIRDSLVLPKTSAFVSDAPAPAPASVPAAPVPVSIPALSTSVPKTLWTPPAKVPESSPSAGENFGLWTPSTRRSIPTISAEEDAESVARRNKGRKTIQKKARRAEILAQIRAVKAGLYPFERFEGMVMWQPTATGTTATSVGLDWLHSVCVVKRRKSTASKGHSRKVGSSASSGGSMGSRVVLRF